MIIIISISPICKNDKFCRRHCWLAGELEWRLMKMIINNDGIGEPSIGVGGGRIWEINSPRVAAAAAPR